MLDVLIAQVRKVFSSKKNGGRLLQKKTDTLHDYKQVIFAISIATLAAYSKFRKDFKCVGLDIEEANYLTDFCWINGTTTQANRWAHRDDTSVPHIGINFKFNDGRYEQINHNYMRSLWILLILMPLCSYVAQLKWSSLFNHDTLIAVLKLPGHENMEIVKTASKLHPFETLNNLLTKQEGAFARSVAIQRQSFAITINEKPSPATHSIEILHGDSNDHHRALDYYIDQLICLLIAKKASAYRLSELGLRRKLIIHAVYSTLLTMMQFILPWQFIGDEYKLYGWNYFKQWLKYTLNRFRSSQAHVNTIDYDLSAYIWPTLAQCEYKMIDNHKNGRFTVQCTIPINETCGKFFAVIWWFIVINIVIELYYLLTLLLFSSSHSTTRWYFGRKFWPHTVDQAKSIATFRYRRLTFLHERQRQHGHLSPQETTQATDSSGRKQDSLTENLSSTAGSEKSQLGSCKQAELSDRERKIFEAQTERSSSTSWFGRRDWKFWRTRDIGGFVTGKSRVYRIRSLMSSNRQVFRDEDGFKEREENLNVYFLLYLMHLRLDCSRRKVEHVIRATSKALNKYLDYLRQIDSDATASDFFESTRDLKSSDSDIHLG